MAPTPVQAKGNFSAGSGNSIAVTLGSAITGGNLVVVAVECENSSLSAPTSVTDGTNTYTLSGSGIRDSNDNQALFIYYKENATGVSSPTVTATLPASLGFRGIVVSEYSGVPTSTALDVAASYKYDNIGHSAITTNAITTLTNGDLVVAVDVESSTGGTSTAGTGWTRRIVDGGGMALEDQVQASAGSITGTFTSSSGSPLNLTGIIAFKPAAGLTNYTLNVSPGSYAVTGTAASPLTARRIGVSPGSYTLTGKAAQTVRGRILKVSPGSYAVTGDTAGLTATRTIPAAPGSYAVTGKTAAPVAARFVNGAPGAYTLTGTAATSSVGRMLGASPGGFTVSGADADALADRTLSAATGSYTVTADDADIVYGQLGSFALDAAPAAYTITGHGAAVPAARLASLAAGSYAVAGAATAALAARIIGAHPGTLTLTGATAHLSAARIVSAAHGVYTLAGVAALLADVGHIAPAPVTPRTLTSPASGLTQAGGATGRTRTGLGTGRTLTTLGDD